MCLRHGSDHGSPMNLRILAARGTIGFSLYAILVAILYDSVIQPLCTLSVKKIAIFRLRTLTFEYSEAEW